MVTLFLACGGSPQNLWQAEAAVARTGAIAPAGLDLVGAAVGSTLARLSE